MSLSESLTEKIAIAERKIAALEVQANDPEIWAECGYFIQQDIYELTAYCNVLYAKISTL